ncbi:MAG: hypothetical protein NT166_29415 [Candidatus Aminicenantes bacterium]|nr:hypothetical protein [Candidatus Aminicenantes bacterium]
MNKKIGVISILIVFGILVVLLLTGVITPPANKEKANLTIYKMYPGQNRLVVDDSTGKSTGKENVKIYFNDKDYTGFVEKLTTSQPLCFASSHLLIFGKNRVTLKNKQWQCDAGILFLPGEKEISIIDASGISFDEDAQILSIKTGKVKHISLATNLEAANEQQEMIIDFSKGDK